jgi:hypothetical protein
MIIRKSLPVAALIGALGGLLLLGGPSNAEVGAPDGLPFFAGEELNYRLSMGRMGTIGQGAMRVEGPVRIRGTETYHLRFDVEGRAGPIRASDQTSSWVDPRTMASLRFEKTERHPFSKHHERVELFPGERRWEGAGGETGRSPTDAPLDELSFIYFVRTLPLSPGSAHQFDRHFQMDRNPVSVRVLSRETLALDGGEYAAILVEMRVRDPRRYRGAGTIRLHLSDDLCRLPLRIESDMPNFGRTVLTLESHSHPTGRCRARVS